jgi:hypothetical protein
MNAAAKIIFVFSALGRKMRERKSDSLESTHSTVDASQSVSRRVNSFVVRLSLVSVSSTGSLPVPVVGYKYRYLPYPVPGRLGYPGMAKSRV